MGAGLPRRAFFFPFVFVTGAPACTSRPTPVVVPCALWLSGQEPPNLPGRSGRAELLHLAGRRRRRWHGRQQRRGGNGMHESYSGPAEYLLPMATCNPNEVTSIVMVLWELASSTVLSELVGIASTGVYSPWRAVVPHRLCCRVLCAVATVTVSAYRCSLGWVWVRGIHAAVRRPNRKLPR